ncbi:DUF1643 domain-containing protein [bacterium]|nr:DUF1643 domain-containing protein [bacterium]
MFNPSKACPEFRDSTIQNCYNLIKNEKYNYNCMEILNVFSSRNPEVDKKSLKNFDNANNLKFIEKFLETENILMWLLVGDMVKKMIIQKK